MCYNMVHSLMFGLINSGRPVLLLQINPFRFEVAFGVLCAMIIISDIMLSKNLESISAPITTPRVCNSGP